MNTEMDAIRAVSDLCKREREAKESAVINERRERIATAVLAALCVEAQNLDSLKTAVYNSIIYADALIAEMDRK